MTRRTVLLTGAGGAATPGLIEQLQRQGFRVLAADMNPQAAGFFVADRAFTIPAGATPEFVQALRWIVQQEHVDAIVPLVDEELEAALALEDAGVVVLLPRLPFVRCCLDKYLLSQALERAHIGVPRTRLASEGPGDLGFPLVVKPRTGRGSRGLSIVADAAQLAECLAATPYALDRLLLQEHIDGTEYTVSVVVWRDGVVRAVVPKEIIVKRGITQLAVTRHVPAIAQACEAVQRALRADGPFNVQLRIDRATGEPRIFEINPRFSTTVSLTIAAGVDEVGGLLQHALGTAQLPMQPAWRDGLVLVRRTLDTFVDAADFDARSARIVDLSAGAPRT